MRRALLVTVLGLSLANASWGHTLNTKTGHAVSHSHPGGCTTASCSSNSLLESSPYNFSSSQRIYSSTTAWNCHGRTFDNRGSWTPYADPWLDWDGPVCPVSPAVGDTVIFWGDSGYVDTSHSVTITGAWNGTSTQVMSKYGSQGQYRHALSNSVYVYGPYWTVTRFTAGTVIYSGATAGSRGLVPNGVGKQERATPALIEQTKEMPWYKSVLASEILYAAEHPRLVAQSAGLRPETLKKLSSTEEEAEQIAILFEDLKAPAHFEVFALYNSPAFSEDFVKELEAGKILAQVAKNRPWVRQTVVDGFVDLVLRKDGKSPDPLRGAAVYFLSQITPDSERAAVQSDLRQAVGAPKAQAKGAPSYLEYYLEKMTPKQ